MWVTELIAKATGGEYQARNKRVALAFSDGEWRPLMTPEPESLPGSSVNSTGVAIAVGFGILVILFAIGIIQFCCKYKCKKKCCKKKKPSLKEKILTKAGTKKSSPPFSISSIVK